MSDFVNDKAFLFIIYNIFSLSLCCLHSNSIRDTDALVSLNIQNEYVCERKKKKKHEQWIFMNVSTIYDTHGWTFRFDFLWLNNDSIFIEFHKGLFLSLRRLQLLYWSYIPNESIAFVLILLNATWVYEWEREMAITTY